MFFERKGHLFIGRFGELFKCSSIIHGFSTRRGGVSLPPYDTLNLGSQTGDDEKCVKDNRKRTYHAIGVMEKQLAVPQQIHNDHILAVQDSGVYPETDGLLTNKPNLFLTVQVADCLPLFYYDPVSGAIGLIHAGWRGSLKGIGAKAVFMMQKKYNSPPEKLRVFIGPGIGPCCYSVGFEVKKYFPSRYFKNDKLDLWQLNVDQLLDAGVTEWFFSHRASGGKTGRMMGILGIKK